MDLHDSQRRWLHDTCDCVMGCIMDDSTVTTCDCYCDVPLLEPNASKPPIYWSQLRIELGLSDTSFEDTLWPDCEKAGVSSPPPSNNPMPLCIPNHDSPPQKNSGNGLNVTDVLYNLLVPDSPDSRVNSPSSWARPHLNQTGYTLKRKGWNNSSNLVHKKPKKMTIKEQLKLLKDCTSSKALTLYSTLSIMFAALIIGFIALVCTLNLPSLYHLCAVLALISSPMPTPLIVLLLLIFNASSLVASKNSLLGLMRPTFLFLKLIGKPKLICCAASFHIVCNVLVLTLNLSAAALNVPNLGLNSSWQLASSTLQLA